MGSLSGPGRFSFGGVHNKYFAFLLHPDPENEPAVGAVQGARYLRVYDADFAREFPDEAASAWLQIDCELDLMIQVPPTGGETLQRYRIYAGPKSEHDLVAAWPAHQVLIDEDLGFFSGVAKLILGLLRFYQGIIGNWGWSIILMTFTVRLLLFPFNRRMQTSMARYQTKMKRVQPLINAVTEKYKDDPTKLRQEQGRIMQQEQAFPPLGGCLPMLLQIPVFWGLFQALRVDFELRQAPCRDYRRDAAGARLAVSDQGRSRHGPRAAGETRHSRQPPSCWAFRRALRITSRSRSSAST
jgi:YidC/Oxa1 family membrane protein insertase